MSKTSHSNLAVQDSQWFEMASFIEPVLLPKDDDIEDNDSCEFSDTVCVQQDYSRNIRRKNSRKNSKSLLNKADIARKSLKKRKEEDKRVCAKIDGQKVKRKNFRTVKAIRLVRKAETLA